MTAYHATHESPFDDACPDCAGYTVQELAVYAATGRDPRERARIGLFLQFVIALGVIVALAVIVRLAVSR